MRRAEAKAGVLQQRDEIGGPRTLARGGGAATAAKQRQKARWQQSLLDWRMIFTFARRY